MIGPRAALALVLASVLFPAPNGNRADPEAVTVHEWGTFTSVAGADGQAVQWRPDVAPPDLPCFVDRIRFEAKPDLAALIRMETPVLYFYAPQDTTVDVNVRFRQGLVTEWFPSAAVTPSKAAGSTLQQPGLESSIAWKRVRVLPRAESRFPTEPAPSHYYAARDTDAAPIEVGGEREKFLFYRGVAQFAPPLSATVEANGRVRVSSPGGQAVGHLVLFENRGGAIRFGTHHGASAAVTLDPPAKEGRLAALRSTLESILVREGLYPKEAAAMVETWRDSWFEEGARLFYIAPKPFIDHVLPLRVSPAPAGVSRVFVGRIELMTRRTLDDLASAAQRGDRAGVAQYGRFLGPLFERIVSEAPPGARAALQARVRAAYLGYYATPQPRAVCR